ncbi:MAG: SET domain-containing protein-lysine N-methyltransferase [Bdellovibrionia bacterium]
MKSSFVKIMKDPKVYIGSAGKKGRGVFAKRPLKKGEILESSPYIEIPPRDGRKLTDTIINSYWYDLDSKSAAIGLGLTSLYNHSENPSAKFSINRRRKMITITAIRNILPKEEISVHYGYKLG